MDSEQDSVFQSSARVIVDAVLEGFNGVVILFILWTQSSIYVGTIFAYGQTGTGKSFTMEGPKETTPENEGIVPRSARHIFNSIKQQSRITYDQEYLILIGC